MFRTSARRHHVGVHDSTSKVLKSLHSESTVHCNTLLQSNVKHPLSHSSLEVCSRTTAEVTVLAGTFLWVLWKADKELTWCIFIIHFRMRDVMWHASVFHTVIWQTFWVQWWMILLRESIFWRVGISTFNTAIWGENN